MVRATAIASLLLSLVIPSATNSASLEKEADLGGVRLTYVEQGSGEPIVFVGEPYLTFEPGSRSGERSPKEMKAKRIATSP